MNNNAGITEFEAQGGHDKEAHRCGFSKMIAEEGSLSLTLRAITAFVYIFGDSRLSDVESEFYQFSMDTGRAPEQIFVIHTLDKRA